VRELFLIGGVKITKAKLQGGPLISSCYGNWGSAAKSNLVHFSFKIWQLVATVLMILLIINNPCTRKYFFPKNLESKCHVWPPGKFLGSFDAPVPQVPAALWSYRLLTSSF